ncbi:Putative Glycoside Hydrolase Family 43 [Podospora comata]|uniref:Glycoside Hydrolase Family 43 n=1 Tax=Podospora comata TaxID=48703 RepID=A0ABY6RTI0_PODCO|nr:Putative Glycoside Hydrolase Family 43 [Podospora comata]
MYSLLFLAFLPLGVLSSPRTTLGNLDFPDPSVTFDPATSKWYAFATSGNTNNVQVAWSPSFPSFTSADARWTLLNKIDLLPTPGDWVNDTLPLIWAPDVHFIPQTKTYVMYYSGRLSGSPYHCIGVAVSKTSILGPYTPHPHPFACPDHDGGAIDSSGFFDAETNRRYVIYKVDGSAKGKGGPCGNGDKPGFPTPFVLQEVDISDGFTPVGPATTVLDRIPEIDGPLIEAPNLVKTKRGRYVLFYSSHCYNTVEYDVRYAVAENIKGPWVRMGELIGRATQDYGFVAPGGASVVQGGEGGMVFHADCEAGRCMYETSWGVGEKGEVVLSDA